MGCICHSLKLPVRWSLKQNNLSVMGHFTSADSRQRLGADLYCCHPRVEASMYYWVCQFPGQPKVRDVFFPPQRRACLLGMRWKKGVSTEDRKNTDWSKVFRTRFFTSLCVHVLKFLPNETHDKLSPQK